MLILASEGTDPETRRHEPEWAEFVQELESRGVPTDRESLETIAVTDPDPDLRWLAVKILELREASEAKEVLKQVLRQDESRLLRETAAVALARLGDSEGLKSLGDLYDTSEDRQRKMFLATRLAELGDARGYPLVRQLAHAEDWTLRLLSIGALGQFLSLEETAAVDTPELLGVLEALSRDPKTEIREELVTQMSLAVYRGVDAELLRPLLERMSQEDPSPTVRGIAGDTLLSWQELAGDKG